MGAVDTPYEDRIVWRDTPQGGEGESRLGRYVHTRREDGTFDVEFIGREKGGDLIGQRMSGTEAYNASVEHNKKLLGIIGGDSDHTVVRRRRDAPVCPKCHTTHAGDECW
jgi:hypothetical protein